MKTSSLLHLLVAASAILACATNVPAQSIMGRVTEWGDNTSGIKQVIVRAYRPDSMQPVGQTLTDGTGAYELKSLPTDVPIEIRFEKDRYMRRPAVWTTKVTSADSQTHDEELCEVPSVIRDDGPTPDPAKIAGFLKAKAPASGDRAVFYEEQWKTLAELIPGEGMQGRIAAALVKLDPESEKAPGVATAYRHWKDRHPAKTSQEGQAK